MQQKALTTTGKIGMRRERPQEIAPETHHPHPLNTPGKKRRERRACFPLVRVLCFAP